MIDSTYDLAIMHIVDVGPEHGGKHVRLTQKADAGSVGGEVVFEFTTIEELDDFIEQLKSIRNHAWGET